MFRLCQLSRGGNKSYFSLAKLCSGENKSAADTSFWPSSFLTVDRQLLDEDTKSKTVVSACAHFLIILMDKEDGICAPRAEDGDTIYTRYREMASVGTNEIVGRDTFEY
mmetsp:Transcript_5500/g.5735  ORF Transcript_5500/g.5735 Transcript_5500/m.5735 type:complete len:109 (-) Transcript_5500:329-655(-)